MLKYWINGKNWILKYGWKILFGISTDIVKIDQNRGQARAEKWNVTMREREKDDDSLQYWIKKIEIQMLIQRFYEQLIRMLLKSGSRSIYSKILRDWFYYLLPRVKLTSKSFIKLYHFRFSLFEKRSKLLTSGVEETSTLIITLLDSSRRIYLFAFTNFFASLLRSPAKQFNPISTIIWRHGLETIGLCRLRNLEPVVPRVSWRNVVARVVLFFIRIHRYIYHIYVPQRYVRSRQQRKA